MSEMGQWDYTFSAHNNFQLCSHFLKRFTINLESAIMRCGVQRAFSDRCVHNFPGPSIMKIAYKFHVPVLDITNLYPGTALTLKTYQLVSYLNKLLNNASCPWLTWRVEFRLCLIQGDSVRCELVNFEMPTRLPQMCGPGLGGWCSSGEFRARLGDWWNIVSQTPSWHTFFHFWCSCRYQ